MKRWYLIYTKPRKEMVAEENLQRQGWDVYLPLLQQPQRRRGRWIEKIEPLFPRYLFVHLRLGFEDISPIRYTTGVQSLVRFTEKPAVVSDQIVEAIRRTADLDTGLHHTQGPLFKSGDKVVIDKGPLAGIQAIFLAETGHDRVNILLEMLGRESRVTVKRDLLRLA